MFVSWFILKGLEYYENPASKSGSEPATSQVVPISLTSAI
jgi:hypothetical protein